MTAVLVPPWLPEEIAATVDLGELAFDDEKVRDELRGLEVEIGHHVAAYRVGARGRENALCQVFEIADLNGSEVAYLQRAERRTPGVVYVAYQKPLVRRSGLTGVGRFEPRSPHRGSSGS